MGIVVELPPELEKALVDEAGREGVTPAEQAALLLCLVGAMLEEGPETPFRGAVRSFLTQHRVDSKQFASAFGRLKSLCLDEAPRPESEGEAGRLDGLLRAWRDAGVHGSEGGESMPTSELPARSRPSIRGKYAYIGFSSDDHAREKQFEIDREDRS